MPVDKQPIKELLKQDDVFLSSSEKLYDYAVKNKNTVIAVIVIILVLIFSISFFISSQEKKHNEQIIKYEKASSLDNERNYEKIVAGLEALKKENLSKINRLVALDLVGSKLQAQQADMAIEDAKALLANLNPKDPTRTILMNTIASYYENMGLLGENQSSFSEAKKYYVESLEKTGNDILKIDLMISIARVSSHLGEHQEAVNYLEKTILDYGHIPEAQMAIYYLAKIRIQHPDLKYYNKLDVAKTEKNIAKEHKEVVEINNNSEE